MKQWAKKQTGFTIVELLIVIVVIAILAAVTIVAYNGIRQRAITSQVQNAVSQANKSIIAYAALNNGNYPASLTQAGVPPSTSVTYEYTYNNTVSPRTYAITVANEPAGSIVYYVSSAQESMNAGIAPGHNLLAWKEPDAASAPVLASSGVTIDTSQFRNAPASTRLSVGATGKMLRSSPFSGTPGQKLTVSLYIQSDSNWNGTGNNSKIRFGDATNGGALLKACSFNGVKTTWTLVECDYTFTQAITSVQASVGNDGSIGNIWLDDMTVAIE